MLALLSRILFVAILAAFPSFLAINFFDAPVLHGFISFDIFFLSLLLLRKRSNLLWQIPLSVSIFLFAFWENTIAAYMVGFVYFIAIWLFCWFECISKVKLLFWILSSLFVIVSDWSIFFESAFSITLGDLLGIAKFYWWGVPLFFMVPLLQMGTILYFFRFAIRKRERIPTWAVFFALSLLLGINFILGHVQKRITMLDFPLYSFFEQQTSPSRISHNVYLQADIKRHYRIIHEKELMVDSIQPTIMILVESWGVRKNFTLNDSDFNFFSKKNVKLFGIRERLNSYTQGAEWEDFKTPNGIANDSSPIALYGKEKYQTWYLHGYDGDFYDREKNYPRLGFDSLKFKNEFINKGLRTCNYGFTGICDSAMSRYVELVMSDSVKKFIYWTTLDSHPPYETQSLIKNDFCKSQNLSKIECIHETRIRHTLKQIASLAEKYPKYRFIVQGDHRPMGSLAESDFVQSFYYRWVPVIVLNGK